MKFFDHHRNISGIARHSFAGHLSPAHPQARRNLEGTGRVGSGRAEGVTILANTRAGRT